MNIYVKFALITITSTVAMFGLMHLNTHTIGHIYFSETRAYMVSLMGAIMAAICCAVCAACILVKN